MRWFKDGIEIRKGKKYEIIAKGVQRILIISKAVFDDEAEYECDARTSKSSGMLTVVGECRLKSSLFIDLFFCAQSNQKALLLLYHNTTTGVIGEGRSWVHRPSQFFKHTLNAEQNTYLIIKIIQIKRLF